MKVRYNALQNFALMLVLLLLGAQGAWANLCYPQKATMGNNNPGCTEKVCSPTIHFKLPEGWSTAYVGVGGGTFQIPKPDANGWSTFSMADSKLVGTNNGAAFFISSTKEYSCSNGNCLTKNGVNVSPQQPELEGFSCATFGDKDSAEVWIMEHPDVKKAGKVYVKLDSEPVIKDFYVFLPDNKTWKSSTPMIYEDGQDYEMYVGKTCGWYYRRYIDVPELPSEVYIHRDDDDTYPFKDAIGKNGAWEESLTPEAIPLASMFTIYAMEPAYNNALYFVADEDKAKELVATDMGWYVEAPDIAANCEYKLAAKIYDTDASLHPSFSCYIDGASASNDGCQATTGTAAQGVDKTTALTAINNCIGVTPGLVKSTLDPVTKKPELSTKGKTCFIDEAYFNQLFNYTKGVNEKSCFDMPFTQASDGKWEFDSDYFTSPGLTVDVQGGFYPVEGTTDAIILAADPTQTPVPAARTKRKAEGPVYYGAALREIDPTEGMPIIDITCNGPGWDGGHKCDGHFGGGTETEEFFATIDPSIKCVFGWSCPQEAPAKWPMYTTGTEELSSANGATARWTSEEGDKSLNGGRNQHFCFEANANFRFKHGLKFNFRGDDDIWVFIDNKLAVDLGGTHLAAPGYVDLDKFMPNAKVDSSYDIDIFFCDRRTTMSNVRIKTNMYIEQSNGIEEFKDKNHADYSKNGNLHYGFCYTESGDGSCAAEKNPSQKEKRYCDQEIVDANIDISYVFTTDKTGMDAGAVLISAEDFKTTPRQAGGGLDVTNPVDPIINTEILKGYYKGGRYYLIVTIGTKSQAIEVKISGSLGVANRDAVSVDEAGNHSLVYPFQKQMMAAGLDSTGSVNDVDQLLPIYVAEILDPCSNPATCTDPLEMHAAAEGTKYKLISTNPNVAFFEKVDGKVKPIDFSKKERTIGASGLDTVYATIAQDDLTASEELASIYVSGNASRKADVMFYAPKLIFVKNDTSTTPISQDPKDYKRMTGSSYEFYLLALRGDNSPCTECKFTLEAGSEMSPGLRILSGFQLENGRAKIYVSSSIVYERDRNGQTATLDVAGPASKYTRAKYTELQFQEPPIPIPQFADIFDVHGEKPSSEYNVPTPYFSMEQEYLDGIGDSIVVYYHRSFHRDSLPDKIVVNWAEDSQDTVVFDHEAIVAGATCNIGGKADSCLNRIILNGKPLSKSVKTGGAGMVKSHATYCPKYNSDGKCATDLAKDSSESVIYDRIAPVIVSARAITDTASTGLSQLKLLFSEKAMKTTAGMAEGDNLYSFYINTGKEAKYLDFIKLGAGAYDQALDSNLTLLYSPKSDFPQAGDYIHVRGINGIGLIMDQSDYKKDPSADSMRTAVATIAGETSTTEWNVMTGYDSKDRLPSPWVLITGDVSAYAVRLVPDAKTSVPLSPSEAAKLPVVDVFTFDANKDLNDFANSIKDGTNGVAGYGFVPHGWYVKSDMGALVESTDEISEYFGKDGGVHMSEVYFDYELEFFTNLGAFVASKTGRVYCDDKKNYELNHTYYFDGKDCVKSRKNFYVVWNMKSNDNRLVGAGAYISKLKSFVQLGPYGKKNKNDKSEMWGVRHGNGKSTFVVK